MYVFAKVVGRWVAKGVSYIGVYQRIKFCSYNRKMCFKFVATIQIFKIMAKGNPIGVRFDQKIIEKYPDLTPQKILNKLIEQDLGTVKIQDLTIPTNVAKPLGSEKPKSNFTVDTIPGYPTDFNGLLKMAKEGVSNIGEFKVAVAASKLNGNQKSMVLSKLTK